ncbi:MULTISPECIES: polysaccharide pyruvyl transferase family protein [Methanobacterium]|nr:MULTISPECIES: polysaccharide pyruvyl transferase family protein [Methanobacterium]
MKEKIFMFGYYGWKNTGDDAMIYVLIQEFFRKYPLLEFVIVSQESLEIPVGTENFVRFIEMNPFVILKEILSSSTVLWGGGTFMYDHTNTQRQFVNLSMILALIVLSKLLKKEVYLLSIGVEPLTTRIGKFLSKSICRLSGFVSVRDSISLNTLENLGLNEIKLSFDLSALLEPRKCHKKTENKILGMSILPFFSIYHNDPEKDMLMVYEIAKALKKWFLKDKGNIIYLFTFKGKSKDDDVEITKILEEKLDQKDRVMIIPYKKDPLDSLALFSCCDAFVGMRYHSCVFAYLSDIPLLIINYFQKCGSLAEDTGMMSAALISPEDILEGKFGGYLENFMRKPEDFKAKLPTLEARSMAKEGLPFSSDVRGFKGGII